MNKFSMNFKKILFLKAQRGISHRSCGSCWSRLRNEPNRRGENQTPTSRRTRKDSQEDLQEHLPRRVRHRQARGNLCPSIWHHFCTALSIFVQRCETWILQHCQKMWLDLGREWKHECREDVRLFGHCWKRRSGRWKSFVLGTKLCHCSNAIANCN